MISSRRSAVLPPNRPSALSASASSVMPPPTITISATASVAANSGGQPMAAPSASSRAGPTPMMRLASGRAMAMRFMSGTWCGASPVGSREKKRKAMTRSAPSPNWPDTAVSARSSRPRAVVVSISGFGCIRSASGPTSRDLPSTPVTTRHARAQPCLCRYCRVAADRARWGRQGRGSGAWPRPSAHQAGRLAGPDGRAG